jgi:hypothetical protein
MVKNVKRVYDGSKFCSGDCCCPVVDFDEKNHTVILSDPLKPENGQFKTSAEKYRLLILIEYNRLLKKGELL